MPRLVSVSEVRRALYWAAGGPASAGGGEPTEAVLGTAFHEVFSGLTGPDENENLVRPLERADRDLERWTEELAAHAYAWHVAPALHAHAGVLQTRTAATLDFWRAVQALCRWLSGVVWEQVQGGVSVSEARERVFVAHEQDVSLELTDPRWTDSVQLDGRIDALLRQPATGALCLAELKTGRAAPEADLCQAALYQLVHGGARRDVHVAVVAFQPEVHERLFTPADIQEAQGTLKALVGRLAGVLAAEPTPPARREAAAPPDAAAAHAALGQRLVDAFSEFGIGLKVDGPPLVGPTFLRFFMQPGRGVRPKGVKALAEAVWTRIRTDQPPQVSVQQGRLAIDVQRPDRQTVSWSAVREALPRPSSAGSSCFPVGVAVDGSLRWADLGKPENSHFLVAGTAGSGKSEWLRAAIASLLAANPGGALRLVLIDPKRTAFASFEGAAALLRPVVYPGDEDPLVVFTGLIAEMEERYRLFAEARVQDLAAYNRSGEGPRARVVVVCDEFADLLMAGDRARRQEMETAITRIAQKGRAAGIHLVLATQQPSRKIVAGALDANLMARVGLKMAREIESQMIVGEGTAASLLGRGDLLFRDLGDPVRLQSPYVTETELSALLRG